MLVTKTTTVEKSDKKYNISEDDGGEKVIPLKGLSGIPPFTRVTCEAKVVQVEEPTETANGKTLQNVMIADSSGMAKVTLWESDVHKLEADKSYRFSKMMLREFRGQTQLSSTKDESLMEEIDDLGVVHEDDDLLLSSAIEEATIVGVFSLEKYSTCLKCNGKITNAKGEIGTCSKCGMLQCLEACKEEVAAQMMIKSSTGNTMLKAYGKVLQQIAGEEVTSIGLLRAGSFTAFHQDGIIRSVKVEKH